ncbi:pickpocket protein 28-like [Lycorma delicatula]|uniref:pickpocket protein 28-like n=1 Tax=Lycorma delicatula TaxID=130591 RepID=UPI003F519452
MRSSPINNSKFIPRTPYHINHLRKKLFTHYDNNKVPSLQLSHPKATASEGCWVQFNMYLKSYCDMASLHGLRYFAERSRPFYERLFWIIVMLLVCFGMAITINHQILHYLSNSILLSINGNNVPVWNVPFPAITLCRGNQIPASVYNISNVMIKSETENLTTEEIEQLHLASVLCSDSNGKTVEFDDDGILENISIHTFELGIKTCKKTIKNLYWHEKKVENPCSLMQFSKLFSGVCHSFNMVPPLGFYSQTYIKNFISSIPLKVLLNYPYKYMYSHSHWSPDTGYLKKGADSLPFRLPGGNLAYSVNFILDFEADNVQEYCMPRSYGFMVAVHNPSEKPSLNHFLTYAEVDRSTILHITPKLIETDPALRNWTPTERGCYYSHERKLMFFDIYSYNNCEVECEANVTFEKCNCNNIFQPRFSDTPVCGKEKKKCFLDSLIASSSSSYDSNHRKALFSACDCLPACTELFYDVNVHSIPRNWTYNSEVYGISPNETNQNTYAHVLGFYNSVEVQSIVRVGVISQSDFIAKIGGVMSLFLGFSFISMFEMFYFSSVRWLTDLRKKKCDNGKK